MRLNNRGNWSLIGLLAAVAIVAVLAYVMFGSGGVGTVKEDSALLDKGSEKKTVVGKSLDTAKSVDCENRLRQIRSGVEMTKTSNTDGRPPATLKDAVPGVSTSYFYCPVSEKAYTYDAATGRVQCPTHPTF